jgi:hypothetical protein
MNGANSDLILLKLWDQYAKQIDVTPLTENASTGVDIDTSEAVSKSPRTLSSTFAQVAKFYKLGLQRAWESILGNHPKATDHLTQVESSFTVPEIETTANIEERLRRYGLEILDLPALEPIAYK